MPRHVGYSPSKKSPGKPWVTKDPGGKIKTRHRTKKLAAGSVRAVNAKLYKRS